MHDRAYRGVFAFAYAVAELLREFASDVVQLVDLATLRRLPADTIENFELREGDSLWEVQIKDSERHMLVHLEFQSTYDADMTPKVLGYVARGHQEEGKKFGDPAVGLPPVLPVVVHNGKTAWGSVPPVKIPADVIAAVLAHPYVLVDSMREDPAGLDAGRFGSLVVLIEQADSGERVWELARAADALLESAGQHKLRGKVREWIVDVRLDRVDPKGEFPREKFEFKMKKEEEMSALRERSRKWNADRNREWLEKGRAEGVATGLEKGRAEAIGAARDSVLVAAGCKFGPEAEERLRPVLERLSDPDRLVALVGAVFESRTVDELVAAAGASPS